MGVEIRAFNADVREFNYFLFLLFLLDYLLTLIWRISIIFVNRWTESTCLLPVWYIARGEMIPFKPYTHRYLVPYRASGSTAPFWYSIKHASAYIIVLASYSA